MENNINDMQKMRMIMSIITARELVKAILKNREEDTEKQKTI